jgi:hypothetical protein
MKKVLFIGLCLSNTVVFSQIKLKDVVNKAESKQVMTTADSLEKKVEEKVEEKIKGEPKLSNEDVINGLKEALNVGTNNSTASASKLDGFYKNPSIMIPFPEQAIKVKNFAEKAGLKLQTDKFVETLNRGAEEAAKDAQPIFMDAIRNMSISDGFAILNGNDSAATKYLREKTIAELRVKFLPKVHDALQKVEVTKYWNPIVTKYNKVPKVEKQNPDLDAYVTDKTLEGLFKLVAEEETKIRKDPAARVSDILKKVFGQKKSS